MIKKQQHLSWRAALQAAVLEGDPARAAEKTRAAEAAVATRIRAFSPSPGFAEEQELFAALDTIRLLKLVRSGTPA